MTTEERGKLEWQIMRHEGLRLKIYADTEGVPTIGYGRNLRDKGLSADEALMLLSHDLDECIRDCAQFPWFVELDPVRQRVIVDMRFNLGLAKLKRFRKMADAIARQDYETASAEMLDSRWAEQVGDRALRLAGMMLTGKDVA